MVCLNYTGLTSCTCTVEKKNSGAAILKRYRCAVKCLAVAGRLGNGGGNSGNVAGNRKRAGTAENSALAREKKEKDVL